MRILLRLFAALCALAMAHGAIAQDDVAAIAELLNPPVAEQKCRNGDTAVCTWIGIAVWTGTGVEKNEAKGNQLLDLGCRGGDTLACMARADDILTLASYCGDNPICDPGGLISPSRPVRMRALAQPINLAACMAKADGGVGCFVAAETLRIGYDLPQDLKQAADLYAMGCDSNHARSCALLAATASQGNGIEVNQTLAFDAGTKGCVLGDRNSCGYAVMAAQTGKVPTATDATVSGLVQKGCALELWPMCYNAALYAFKGLPDPASAGDPVSYFRRGCDGGDPQSCYGLGSMLYEGRGLAKDVTAAKASWIKACDGKVANACVNAGIVARDGGDRTGAAALFRKALEADPQNAQARQGLDALGGQR